jgi:hypothetical protein
MSTYRARERHASERVHYTACANATHQLALFCPAGLDLGEVAVRNLLLVAISLFFRIRGRLGRLLCRGSRRGRCGGRGCRSVHSRVQPKIVPERERRKREHGARRDCTASSGVGSDADERG